MRDLLIGLAPYLWVVAIILGIANTDRHIVTPISLMALAGTVCAQLRNNNDHDKRMLIRTVERLTRDDDSLAPVLRRVR